MDADHGSRLGEAFARRREQHEAGRGADGVARDQGRRSARSDELRHILCLEHAAAWTVQNQHCKPLLHVQSGPQPLGVTGQNTPLQ